ncbi:hypothetical protein O6P43_029798 [Quillaja saponaria]|uniref:Uncharacterized protein n=1 Tax=Quillaja saponaria TaxID=32244 RepID=A0AAD7PC78_QUISA|nr:hypothetical protein O6P43_029798 [Quillaja saponaria]
MNEIIITITIRVVRQVIITLILHINFNFHHRRSSSLVLPSSCLMPGKVADIAFGTDSLCNLQYDSISHLISHHLMYSSSFAQTTQFSCETLVTGPTII